MHQSKWSRFVNPFIGTTSGGNVHPGATLPFAMLNVTPHTETLDWSNMGYNYADSMIVGFVHNQLSGIGNSEFGNFLVMPTLKVDANLLPNFGIRAKKYNEIAEPGFYSVLLDSSILAEVTAQSRLGQHRYTFLNTAIGDTVWVVINLARASHPQKVIASKLIWDDSKNCFLAEGRYNGGFATNPSDYSTFAAFKSLQKPDIIRTWKDSLISEQKSQEGENAEQLGGLLGFMVDSSPFEIELQVGISYKHSLQAYQYVEKNTNSFNETRGNAVQLWENLLGKFLVNGGTDEQKRIFYTALYRMYLMPTDVTGETPGRISKRNNRQFTNYFAIWDTFRAPHPFFTLVEPSTQSEMLNSLLDISDQFGWLPDGHSGNGLTKIQGGTNADILFLDAWEKQLQGVDYERAFSYLLKNATEPSPDPLDGSATRGRHPEYLEKGWLSSDLQWASVSKSLEYAYNDYAVWKLGSDLGKNNSVSKAKERALGIFTLFDDESGFFRPKKSDGNWITDFVPSYTYSPDSWTYRLHYYEGSAWHYLGYVPHLFPKLIEKLGGDAAFVQKWDEQFEKRHIRGYFNIENEPVILAPYQYIYAGRPDKVQEIIPLILSESYHATPFGWPGNDDSGTLSAWYVFSALGFYPNPGQNWYFLGTPLFDESHLQLENGKEIVITVNRNSDDQHYIKKVTLNDRPLNRAFIFHHELINGAQLDFEMSSTPTDWARGIKPPSPDF